MFKKSKIKLMKFTGVAAVLALGTTFAAADVLTDKLAAGEEIRIGFANEVPWAYPGDDNQALGFVNAHVLGVLEKMGAKKVTPVVTEWGGLIPGLNANRFDLITGGMYILEKRCDNINFSEPMAAVSDAFIVETGNPKGVHNYQDIKTTGEMLVTGAGYNSVDAAKKEGVPDSLVMQVPGPTEILAAVKAGRAAAGAVPFFTAQNLAKNSDGTIEVTDPKKLPDWTNNWVGIGFRKADTDFLKAFNEAQKSYLGSDEQLAAVAEYGYTKSLLPEVTTEYACANR